MIYENAELREAWEFLRNSDFFTDDGIKELAQKILEQKNTTKAVALAERMILEDSREKSLYEILDKDCYNSLIDFAYNNMNDSDFAFMASAMSSKIVADSECDKSYLVMDGDEIDRISELYHSDSLLERREVYKSKMDDHIRYLRSQS